LFVNLKVLTFTIQTNERLNNSTGTMAGAGI
jgi:hypothetical protein